jgi:D-alanyl-D-alanine carboxypeptidase/Putative peptidoglycan binding domain
VPNFDSNDPRQFGWSLDFRDFVPFTYAGLSFPQGVHPLVSEVFTVALNRLVSAWLVMPPASEGLGAGMWGQEDREVTGGGPRSFHEYGLAIDVCAPQNPYGVSDPPASPRRLPDNTSSLVEPLGLLWGGSPRWGSHRDRMHIENHNSPAELRALYAKWDQGAPHPVPGPTVPSQPGRGHFPLPAGYYYGPLNGPVESISGFPASDRTYRPGLELAQSRLGVAADGFYGPITAAAVRRFQGKHHLVVDGLIGPKTWASLFA